MDRSYITNVVTHSNEYLMNLGLLNIGSTAHIVDSRLRVELEDIYFHPHTVDHAVNMSTGAAMYTKYVTNDFDNYGLDADKKDNVQHVFLTGDLNSSGGSCFWDWSARIYCACRMV